MEEALERPFPINLFKTLPKILSARTCPISNGPKGGQALWILPQKIYYYFVICYFVMTSLGADPLYVSVNELREVFSEESRAGGHSSDGAE